MSDYPYPGLRPFRPDESDIFFGREEQSDQLLERLGSSHFLALIGTSGCGKSSLVHTGLVAGLQMGLLARAGVRWRIAEFRPGIKPLDALTKALLKFEVLGEAYGSNFSGEEAARLGKEIGAGLVIPCHYEMFEFNTVSPQEFATAAKTIGCPYQVLKVGERWSL